MQKTIKRKEGEMNFYEKIWKIGKLQILG